MSVLELDARGLEPPEPLERALAALALLRPGQSLRLILGREPFPLYGMLDEMGYTRRTEPLPAGEYAVIIGPAASADR